MKRKIKNKIRNLLGIKSETDYYSSAGEDAVVSKTFQFLLPRRSGFYVDIGAFHPYQHSNTYILYKSGWSGINVDPRPGSKALFDKHRPRDTNLEVGISDKEGVMTYYVVRDGPTMNTFSRSNLESLNLLDRIEKEVPVPVITLEQLIDRHCKSTRIDYLNIDAEGFEMEILAGLGKCPSLPDIISLEQNNVFTLSDVIDSEPNRFLKDFGYVPFAKNLILQNIATVFYRHIEAE